MLMLFIILLLISESTVAACPTDCASCTRSNKCDRCNTGYWLTENNYCSLCPSNCEQCTNFTHCTVCKATYWDIRPNMVCSSPCYLSCTASGCNDTTGHCYGCSPGVYGSFCGQNCDLCIDGLCQLRKCKIGCKEGYYQSNENIEVDFECKKCHDHCISCLSLINCTQCETGYYINYDTNGNIFCSPCHWSCEDCISYSECTVCPSGKYGSTCSKDCNISNCKICIEVDSVVTCTECMSGYSLQNGKCYLGTNVCSQYCLYGCDNNGNCLGGCQDGWTGMDCTERCAYQCKQCEQYNGNTCTSCEGDFFTTACSEPCNLHCVTDLVNCNINGSCLNGCSNGYWGDKCDKQCSDGCNTNSCNQSNGLCVTCARNYYGETCQHKCSTFWVDKGAPFIICNNTNGKCLYGCNDRYSGDRCEISAEATSSPTTEKFNIQYDQTADSFTKPFLLGILTGVGISLLLVVAFIVVRHLRKMRQKANNRDAVTERDYENTAVSIPVISSDGGISQVDYKQNTAVYERLDSDTRDDQHQYSGLDRLAVQHGTSFANI